MPANNIEQTVKASGATQESFEYARPVTVWHYNTLSQLSDGRFREGLLERVLMAGYHPRAASLARTLRQAGQK